MGAQQLGTLGGTVAGTVDLDTSRYDAVEALVRVTAGAGTVSLLMDAMDEAGNVYTGSTVLTKSGSATSAGTVVSYVGGVPLGVQTRFKTVVSGTVTYGVTVVGRL